MQSYADVETLMDEGTKVVHSRFALYSQLTSDSIRPGLSPLRI